MTFRYAREHELPALTSEGWNVVAFYGWRGGFACFLLRKA